jgi:Protein of unknown function (DUF2281)
MLMTTTQILQPIHMGGPLDELMIAVQSLSPTHRQQVFDFIEFLAQKAESSDKSNEITSPAKNWVDEASGSMRDIPEFDTVVAYGRAIRLDGAVTIE